MAKTYSIEIDGVKKSGLSFTEFLLLKNKLKQAAKSHKDLIKKQINK